MSVIAMEFRVGVWRKMAIFVSDNGTGLQEKVREICGIFSFAYESDLILYIFLKRLYL